MYFTLDRIKPFIDKSLYDEFNEETGESHDHYDLTITACIKKFQTLLPCFNVEN